MKAIKTLADADGLLLAEIQRQEGKLPKATGRDEVVIAQASRRDAARFIPRRMN